MDLVTGRATIFAPAFALAPLLAALRCRPLQVAVPAVLAVTAFLTTAALLDYLDPSEGQFWVRLATVAGVSGLAIWLAALLERSSDHSRAQSFLDETSVLLGEPDDDIDATLARVARLAVPGFADWCAIDLLDADGVTLRRAGVAHADRAKVELGEELARRWPASLDDPDGAGRTVRTGETQVFHDIPDPAAWPPGTRDPGHTAILARLGLRSGMVVPLAARGRTLGALTLITAESGRRHRTADVALAEEVGRRCALALDNARLRAVARAAGEQLEESFALIEALFESAPIGLAYFDRDLRYVRVNDRMAEINGIPAAEHVGRTTEELFPALETGSERLREVLETGRPVTEQELAGETPALPGRRREWLVSCYPVRRGDTILGVGAVVLEVSERRAAERALRAQTDRYETLMLALAEVGEGMVVLEGDHLVYANDAFEQLTGYPLDELRSMRSIWDLIPDWSRDEAQQRAVLRTREGLVDPHYEFVLTHRSGRLVDLDVAGVPLHLDDREQLVVVVRDITARKRAEAEREHALALERQAREAAEAAERRMTLLAGASALFDQSLDELETLERVARLTVAEVADTCVIMLAPGGGEPARQAIAVARDPRREALMKALEDRWPAEVQAEATVAQVVHAGHATLVRHLGRRFETMAQDEEHLAQVRALDLAAAALVPLRARGRTFGAMACGFVEAPAPDHEREVLALLEDLARRAALAMDNARLYAERSHVARTLQQSLLPPDLPALPGVELSARYRPAGEGNEVGGDFYDCFATSEDEYALVIGDVCGKGPEAAAVTALARYTMRASVLHSGDPVRVLSELNQALLRQNLDSRFCTVLYAALSNAAGGWSARVSSGGHPLPLVLRRDGRVEQLGMPGTLLGIVPDPDLSATDVALGPGDALVIYTDGVIEASPLDDAFGDAALSRLLGTLAGRDAASIAAAIEEAVVDVQHGELRDDVAVVVLRVASGT